MSNEITLVIDGTPVDFIRKDSIPPVCEISAEAGPYKIGKAYHVRTVTMAIHGTLVAVTAQELVLRDAAWIADSGRFSEYLAGKEPNEIEPFPSGDVIIGRGSIVDAFQRDGLFRKAK